MTPQVRLDWALYDLVDERVRVQMGGTRIGQAPFYARTVKIDSCGSYYVDKGGPSLNPHFLNRDTVRGIYIPAKHIPILWIFKTEGFINTSNRPPKS